MIIPYSTDLRVYQKPYVTYGITLLCIIIFYFQTSLPDSVTEKLMYYPDTLNPFTMISSALAHGDFMHILGNLIFFLAFTPAVEILINNKLKFLYINIAISIAVSLSTAISVLISGAEAMPTLGLSGVVTGMIGLSAYLLPKAKIKVFIWFVTLFKTIYIPALFVAIWYIGWDTWYLLANVDRGNINVIAHVAGGFAGYFIGVFFLKQQRDETREELEDEMEYARANRSISTFETTYKGGGKALKKKQDQIQAKKDYAKYEYKILQCVRTDRDGEAINLILENYDIQKDSPEIYEELFDTMKQWGNSRALFCIGRLLINLLIENNKMAKALWYTEQCLSMTERFVLANANNVIYMAKLAMQNHQYELAYLIIHDANNRYYGYVALHQSALMEIELLTQYLDKPQKAKRRIDELLDNADESFQQELLKLQKKI